MILVLDADGSSRGEIRDFLTSEGFRVEAAVGLFALSDRVAGLSPDAVVIGAGPAGDGVLETVASLKERFEHLPVIVVTSSMDASVVAEGMRRGAFDFVSRPLSGPRLGIGVRNAVRMHQLMVKVNQLQSQYQRRGQFMGLTGISPRMQAIYSFIENVGVTDVTVFVTGPSGTGKELIARALHEVSPRAAHPFVAVNCAAIPKDLLESELFGHEKGAFTGAVAMHPGCCEQADGGTLFLDEICEMDTNLQSKLLRFLQERKLHRLGGHEELNLNVRVVSATNRDPLEEVRRGRLREDLYYRLNVVPVDVPPLRERREDIPLLATVFLDRFSAKHGKYFYDVAPDALAAMLAYDWPGNVREMENAMERVVILHTGSQVLRSMLPESVLAGATSGRGTDRADAGVILPMREMERRAIERALAICEGNVARAARRLAIGQATLYRKIKKFGLALERGSRRD